MSMEDRIDELERQVAALRSTLGSMCLVIDYPPHGITPKLGSVEPGTDAAFYFLATYCLDMARKLDYVFLATEPYAAEANPELIRRVKTTNRTIYAENPDRSPKTWEETARLVDQAFFEIIKEIVPRHTRLMSRFDPQYPDDAESAS